ncbi:hypothetical protein [Buchnera aphidicola]|uniref:hypothetical protein n=1 Tax=Buchnera aphidicola TaxID=9 RepID=UPI00094DD264|nr:hypothetical protein [Buchnera aphidicola]
MKNYPWLKKQYKNIVMKYINKKLHPIILIHAYPGMGVSQLIYKVSQWLLCLKKNKLHSCNQCTSCIFIKKRNHPDLYQKNIYKIKKKISIDDIRQIIINIQKTSQQGGVKIVYIKKIQNITIEANNALLKTLEEPPKNTLFFYLPIIWKKFIIH